MHCLELAHDIFQPTSPHYETRKSTPFSHAETLLIHNHIATMSLTNCRFYEEKYPEIDSFVMVNVKQIAEMGAYVKLLEYDNIDGMILLSELSRRRIRSIQKLIRVGRNEVVVVLRVDKDKGYIDLSKRRVSPEDIVKCEERYNKGKMVHSIMRHVAEKINTPIEELYQDIGWPLNKKYGHAVDAFKLSITNPDVWNEVTFKSNAIKDELVSYIGKRLTPQPTKVRADIEVRDNPYTCGRVARNWQEKETDILLTRSLASATRESTPSRLPFESQRQRTHPRHKSRSASYRHLSTFSLRKRSTRTTELKCSTRQSRTLLPTSQQQAEVARSRWHLRRSQKTTTRNCRLLWTRRNVSSRKLVATRTRPRVMMALWQPMLIRWTKRGVWRWVFTTKAAASGAALDGCRQRLRSRLRNVLVSTNTPCPHLLITMATTAAAMAPYW